MAAFVDDTWKVTPKLTLSLGLRYELTPPFVDQVNNLLTVYVPHLYHSAGAPKSDWPYFVRQGNCQDAFNAAPPLPVRWDLVPVPTDPSYPAYIQYGGIESPVKCSNGLLPDALMKTPYKNFAPALALLMRWIPRPLSAPALESSTARIIPIPRSSMPPAILLSEIRTSPPPAKRISRMPMPFLQAAAYWYMSRPLTPTLSTPTTTRLILCSTCSIFSASSATTGRSKPGI
jgi:hypothetical protein